MSIYLDNAATTQVCEDALDAAVNAMTKCCGNPSSTHRLGREAKELMNRSRGFVAAMLGCNQDELYFTSCGTESDNWAIVRGAQYNARRGKHVISSTVEHPAVLRCLDYLETQGFEVTRLKPEPDGSIARDAVMAALRPDTCLVTLMLVQNETGAVTDIGSIFHAVRAQNPHTLLHTDAVQGFLKIPCFADSLGADLISISGHKIHAPKGIGALYIREGLNLPPLLLGGGQENGKRSGTESLPLIAAFGNACAAVRRCCCADQEQMAELRSHAAERLQSENPGLLVIGGGAPHILSISLPGWRSEVLMNYLEAEDIYVSKSSACKKGGRSFVLEEMGLPSEVIDGAIRVSLSRFTTRKEIDGFCDALRRARETIRPSVRRR